jgi:ornithine carbamoyltransferase
MTRHLLDLAELSTSDLLEIIDLARVPAGHELSQQSVAMFFEKPSGRTRNATEMAVVDLGGHPVMITQGEVGIDTRESAEDVARTLGSFHRILAARVNDHGVLVRMKEALSSPPWNVSVVNLLSDVSHPCQAIADVLTMLDEFGDGRSMSALHGKRLCYVGDANNVTLSLAQASLQLGIDVRIAAPQGYQFSSEVLDDLADLGASAGASVLQTSDLAEAADNADVLYSDVWTSMGQEAEHDQRLNDLSGYGIDAALLAYANPDAVVLHCLPAHRGEEITDEVLEGPQSRIWQQVAHRRTAMRGVFRWLLSDGEGS